MWKSEEEDWQTVGYECRLFFGIFKALKDFFQNDVVYGVRKDFHQFICCTEDYMYTCTGNRIQWHMRTKRSSSLGGPCALVMFLNSVFRQEWVNPFLWFLASLINNDSTLRKYYLFSCRCENPREISIYLKSHFYKECQQLRNPKKDFSLTLGVSLRDL